MRFRNYVNRYNRRNRIFSDEDLLKMTLESIFDNEPSILAQNEAIGIPNYDELEQSPNTEWIAPFTNNEGKQDGGYWQSILQPDYSPVFSTGIQGEKVHHGMFGNIMADKTNDIVEAGFDENYEEEPQEKTPFLEGRIEKNYGLLDKLKDNVQAKVDDVKTKIEDTERKYEGLSPTVAAQKAASKGLGDKLIENEYYRNSLKMKDGEELSDKFKEENDIYTLKDITDPEKSKYYKEQLSKMYGYDINDPEIDEKLKDKKIVMPKENSRLYQYAKNSEAVEKWVVDNYDRIKNGENYDDKIEFPSAIKNNQTRGLYTTIHNANVRNAKVNSDGSFAGQTDDPYNYEKWKLHHYKDAKTIKDIGKTLAHNLITRINNRAYEQQQNNQLEDFYISMPFDLTKEEIERIKRKYGMK